MKPNPPATDDENGHFEDEAIPFKDVTPYWPAPELTLTPASPYPQWLTESPSDSIH